MPGSNILATLPLLTSRRWIALQHHLCLARVFAAA